MLPQLREAYRRLQAGKRHARLSPEELLDLRVAIPAGEASARLDELLRQSAPRSSPCGRWSSKCVVESTLRLASEREPTKRSNRAFTKNCR